LLKGGNQLYNLPHQNIPVSTEVMMNVWVQVSGPFSWRNIHSSTLSHSLFSAF
jgi:hypothetical protein